MSTEPKVVNLPDWARYICIDSDGSAWAYERPPELKPTKHITYWRRQEGNRCVSLGAETHGAFRLSDESVARLILPLTEPEP